ncbi:forkhead box protein N1 [Pangasianodon hypophthalmus]|uniref:forkhead box protein N1 n=1 Tax=Pangasianodon hypophthalmus TaxID=310915 RepID=UPI002306E7E0|nr:forkhead box protein N1 [Pangasianodon hypophthalmus]XP_034166818.2 forkhead box protein N1 [Pangasianodon hypophthalmus]
MSTNPGSFSPAGSSSSPKSIQAALLESSNLQMPLSQCLKPSSTEGSVTSSQRDSVLYRLKSGAAERFRRHSVDGSCVDLESESSKDKRFHPYGRQYSDGEITGSSLYCCLRESKLPESLTPANTDIADLQEQNGWTSLSTTVQSSLFMGAEESTDRMQNRPEDPPSYSSSTHSAYSTLSPLHQQFPGEYSSGGLEVSSRYSYQSLSPQTSRDGSVQPQYPKPIYSYSILIFMALRNSRTGSLPVSEIYSFMTEHFPYFKTAPDGWKNSIRHNLSLNKCFEKVENKKGNSSRKGCLWALNPAKVEKMQEELQKWRRKDPATVRRSMARPELLDHLLGDRPEKPRSLSAQLNNHTHSQFPRVSLPPPYTPTTHQRRPYYSYYSLPSQTVSQQLPYLSSSAPAFSFYPSIPQQPSTELPPRTGSLDSPLPAHTPPSYSTALQTSHSALGGMQELLMEGELSNDIDMLNPSLTDLQLHGCLWEELRNDSLASDPLPLMDVSTTSDQLSPDHVGDCGKGCGSGNGEVNTAGSEAALQTSVSDLYITGLCSSDFSGTDCMSGLHSTTTNTPIALL